MYLSIYIKQLIFSSIYAESPCGMLAKMLDCSLEGSEFKLHSCYYVHFWTNTLLKYMNPLIPSSSCRTASTDLPDPLSPLVSIIHCSRLVFKAISCIGTDLLYIGSSWSSCFCSYMWRGPHEYVTYELVFTSPAMSRMSWIVFVMGVTWSYSCSFVACWLQDLFNMAGRILCNCR